MDVRLNAVWSTPKWEVFGGAFAALHRHSFQETLPIPVFEFFVYCDWRAVGISIDWSGNHERGRAIWNGSGR